MTNHNNYMISSVRIAQITHTTNQSVMQKIQKLISNCPTNLGFNPTSFFIISQYKDNHGKSKKCYQITPCGQDVYKLYDNTSNLFAYVGKYHQLTHHYLTNNSTLSVPSYSIKNGIKRAKQWIREQEHLQKVQRQFNYVQNTGTLSTGELAQDYGKTAHWLNTILSKLGIQYYQGGHWNLTRKYKTLGKFASFYDDKHKQHLYLKWYPTARVSIHNILAKNNIDTLTNHISNTNHQTAIQKPVKKVQKQSKTVVKKQAKLDKQHSTINHKDTDKTNQAKKTNRTTKTRKNRKPKLNKSEIRKKRWREWAKHPDKLTREQQTKLTRHQWYLKNRSHEIKLAKRRNHRIKYENELKKNNKLNWRDSDNPF